MTKTVREQKIRALYQARLNYLKDYAVKYKTSPEFLSYCESLFDLLKKDLIPYVSKSGKIALNCAARPSDHAVREQIEKLLKE